jgi:hypothetical protein
MNTTVGQERLQREVEVEAGWLAEKGSMESKTKTKKKGQ